MPSSPISAAALLVGEALIRPDQLHEQLSPLHERPAAQILAIEAQEIEGIEHHMVRRLVDSRAQGVEVGEAVLVLDNHLTIHQGGFAGELGAGLDWPPIGS